MNSFSIIVLLIIGFGAIVGFSHPYGTKSHTQQYSAPQPKLLSAKLDPLEAPKPAFIQVPISEQDVYPGPSLPETSYQAPPKPDLQSYGNPAPAPGQTSLTSAENKEQAPLAAAPAPLPGKPLLQEQSYQAPPLPEQQSYEAPAPLPKQSYKAPALPEQKPFVAPAPLPKQSYQAPALPEQRPYAAPAPLPKQSYQAPALPEQRPYAAPAPLPKQSYQSPSLTKKELVAPAPSLPKLSPASLQPEPKPYQAPIQAAKY
ncbi:PAT1-like protein 1 [Sarcoptes scabiei]|uniref:PAT1-like protein 1 n=1 Tax=Sarcoptes scabiei TaxID=52283 RepID=A0A132A9T4_SARSC|nr:PAT1-like protein 1 [Sarcoptes scabiei]